MYQRDWMRRKEVLTEVETGRCGSVRVAAKTEMSQDGGLILSAGRGSCSCLNSQAMPAQRPGMVGNYAW